MPRIDFRCAWKFSSLLAVLSAFILLLSPAQLSAQDITGRILGSVLDSSGAAVPDAQITITNKDTGVTRNTVSGSDGLYNVPQVIPGTYSVAGMAPGFSPAEVKDVVVTVGTDTRTDLKMQVGSVTQSVTVTEAVPLVETTSSSVGSTVDEQKVADLPLNGRNWTDLTLLQPGVTQVKVLLGTAAVAGFNGTLYSSNGAPMMSNAVSLDGANQKNLMGLNNASMTNTSLGVDGIKEYKVVTSIFSAEYGMSMGSQTTVVSKGGTNRLHGDVFEYLRNSSLDSRNYFDALDTVNAKGFGTDKSVVYPGKRIPPFRRNNFGGSLGGPIIKDKTFFYAVYEGVRQQLGLTITLKTLPAACFVDNAGVSHTKVPAVIQNAALPGTTVGACNSGAPTPINVASVVLPLAGLFPAPNVSGYSSFNYSYPFIQPTAENYGQIRIDHNFSSTDTAFLRWTQDDSTQTSNYNYEPYQINLASWAQFGTIGENHIFTPTLLNTVRLSFSRTDGSLLTHIDQNGPNAPGNLLLVPGQFPGDVGPGGGVTTAGSDTSNEDGLVQTIYTASDDVFWTKGKHAFKFGTLVNYFYDNPEHVYSKVGGVTFSSLTNFFNANYSSLNQFSPFGLGISTNFRYVTAGFYGQDDYRVTNRVTLNLGLRYEFATVPIEPDKALYLSFRNPFTDTVGTPGGMFANPSLHNFSPRIGFAWDVFGTGKTSLRGGAGIYYDIGNYGGLFLNNGDGTPPASLTSIINNTSTTPAIPLTVPLPTNTLMIANTNSVRGVYYNMAQPTLLQRSLELDQQLPWNMGLSIGYVGSRGWHLVQEGEGNPVVPLGLDPNGLPVAGCYSAAGVLSPTGLTATGACPTGFTSTGPRYNKNLGNAAMTKNGGDSYYNGLQVQVNKRISQGFQFQLAYTYARLIDTGQQENPTFNTENTQSFGALYSEAADRGPAVFDATSNLRFNMIYHAPTIGSTGIESKLVNGWWFSSIVSAQSGYPFSPATSLDRALEGLAGGFGNVERLSLDPSFNPHTDIEGSVNQWFNPTQFDLQPAGHYGNAGRDILRGPGFEDVDFSVVKDTKAPFLGEAGSIEFRAEVFNLLNHPNFANPANTVYAGNGSFTAATAPAGQIKPVGTITNGATDPLAALSTVGQITSTVSNSRQIQFALKLVF